MAEGTRHITLHIDMVTPLWGRVTHIKTHNPSQKAGGTYITAHWPWKQLSRLSAHSCYVAFEKQPRGRRYFVILPHHRATASQGRLARVSPFSIRASQGVATPPLHSALPGSPQAVSFLPSGAEATLLLPRRLTPLLSS